MRVDIDGAIHVARLAADFDWQWTKEGVESFCQVAQLQIDHRQPELALLHTQLRVDRPIGFLMASEGIGSRYDRSPQSVMQLMVMVTDTGDEIDPGLYSSLVDRFGELANSFITEFGEPTRTTPGEDAEVGWDLGSMTMLLAQGDTNIHLDLTNPTYLEWWDEQDQMDRAEDEEEEADHSAEEAQIRANGPQSWEERRAALLAAVTRMPIGIDLVLTNEHSPVMVFSMGQRQLVCRVMAGADDVGDHGPDHALHPSRGWTWNSLPIQPYWERSMVWPARYSAYESLVDAAIRVLREAVRVAHPSDIIVRVP
ncbi:DUF6301 family protein [Nocardia tengchongensis]|uniref:DUF6301 family protein n=1 Tax=Nocardia tengchongensis TaxID=2055889 RepID=UPI003689DBFA